MFEYPTVGELAAVIGSEHEAAAKDLDRLFSEIEALPEEEAQKLLSEGKRRR